MTGTLPLPLLRKAWLESRARFALGALFLSVITVALIRFFGRDARQLGLAADMALRPISFMVFGGPPSMLFVILALILGLGGLQRERAAGTAPFTLVLPVSRLQLLGARAIVGLLETTSLAALPAILVLTLTSVVGVHLYPAMPAVRNIVLWTVCGAVWFSAALMWSALISAEMTATAVCLLTPLVWYTTARYTELKQFPSLDVYGVMVGRTTEWSMPYHDFFSGQMVGPLPWTTLLAFAAVAGSLFALAARVTARQSF